jgi:hypothetical protein
MTSHKRTPPVKRTSLRDVRLDMMEVKDTCANHRACRNTPWFHATLQYFSYTCVKLCLTVSLFVWLTKHSINFAMPTETSVVIHWHADVLDSSPDMLTVVKKHLKTKQLLIRVHCIQLLIVEARANPIRNRSESDRISISEIKWINYPRIIARINYPCISAFIKVSSRLSLHYSFDSSIGRHFASFLTCISCFYIYLVKYFNLNEKFILLKNSLDRIELEFFFKTRIGSNSD